MFVYILGKTEMDNLRGSGIVKYGTYSSKGYRMIDVHHPNYFTTLCGFGRYNIFFSCILMFHILKEYSYTAISL